MNIRKNEGITLIALVITIVVLIILAGVSIQLLLGKNGLLEKAKKGAEQYQYENIKEKIEAQILAIDIEKVAKGEKLTIDEALIGVQKAKIFEEIDLEADMGICEGYAIELGYNEQGKVIILEIIKDKSARIVIKLNPNGYTNQKIEVNIEVKNANQNINHIVVPSAMKQKEVGVYEVEANGKYQVEVTLEDGTTLKKEITIATIDKMPPKDFEIETKNTGIALKIIANAEDTESSDTSVCSGIERYEYFVKGKEDTEYQKYETDEITELEVGTYNVYVIAYDKAGNHTQSQEKEVIFYGEGAVWEKWNVVKDKPIITRTDTEYNGANIYLSCYDSYDVLEDGKLQVSGKSRTLNYVNVIGKYCLYGAKDGEIGIFVDCKWQDEKKKEWLIYTINYFSEIAPVARGEKFYDYVIDANKEAYPNNGEKDGYWYVLVKE